MPQRSQRRNRVKSQRCQYQNRPMSRRTKGKYVEYWDIYDENKQPTGRVMKRNDWNMQPGDFHLTVLGVIERSDGTFLITRRVLTKSWAPGWWEVSGGGVRAGESSRDAVIREVLEETGLDVSDCPMELALTYKRVNPEEKDNYFVDVYKIRMNYQPQQLHLQKEETLESANATLGEIRAIAARGEFLHFDSIREVFESNRGRFSV